MRSVKGLLVAFLLLPVPLAGAEGFAFIHMSDEHIPYGNTATVMREAGAVGPTDLAPYGIAAPRPSFVISTGDETEFGGGKGAWEQFGSILREIGLPVYAVAGNHDNTWDSIRPRLTDLQGAPYYSFDHGGIHFVGLDSASPLDPRPNFGREELLWLARDLGRLNPATPIIVFYHHPPGNEFASRYDYYRLWDLLRRHNVLVHLVGHGHGVRHWQDGGWDYVMGGSTFGDNAGFAIADVRNGRLRIAYRKAGQLAATMPLLDKPLDASAPYPEIVVSQPEPGAVVTSPVGFAGTAEGEYAKAEVLLDDEKPFPLALDRGRFRGNVELGPEAAGAHWYRLLFTRADGSPVSRSGDFVADSHPRVKVLWRTMLGGSSKSTPAFLGNLALVGADDGCVYALDTKTGRLKWTVKTGGDILGQPLVLGDRAYVGSADGKLYEVTAKGRVTRTFDAGAPIYSTPTTTGDAIVVATSAGSVSAVGRDDFHQLWRCDAADYCIEDTLCLTGDLVCFGAWDTFIYAVDWRTGKVRWKCAASGTRQGPAARYYSPADCGPSACGDRLYVADRKYHLSIVDLKTGELVASREGVSGTGQSENGLAVYLRTVENGLVKLNAEGKELWTAKVPLGYVATAPTERDDVVYSLSSGGTLSAVKTDTGEVLWTVRTLPGFFALADPAAREGVVYVAGMDGSVTALTARREGRE